MDLEAIKGLLDDFDLSKVLPSLDSITGWIEAAVRIVVMAGPLLLLGFGLLYLLAPPKEANHTLGFRFWWGMSSLECWKFTQKAAGTAWSIVGLVLTLVMAVKCTGFAQLEVSVMLDTAIVYLLWQLGTALVTNLLVALVVFLFFDRKGFRREWTLRK